MRRFNGQHPNLLKLLDTFVIKPGTWTLSFISILSILDHKASWCRHTPCGVWGVEHWWTCLISSLHPSRYFSSMERSIDVSCTEEEGAWPRKVCLVLELGRMTLETAARDYKLTIHHLRCVSTPPTASFGASC